jgi:hypothetical protein
MEEKSKERAEVPEPEPVSYQGTRYEAVPWGKVRGFGQNGGYVAAIDEATGAEKWVLKVYDVKYDPEMEADKQDVFITGLSLKPRENLLRVENERGQLYLVNTVDRTVKGPIS